ncbi:hypothetical protein Glove_130g179 [Diversispora epigaea]|uniref:Uncharacterized protein n=1 Tax=Diversispora epigaea TaxID=1348612 RepID=A0A397J4N5_9GLOM|nr:hypothetical protein Glove_130g179 [Diversispora epigaea]
MSISFMIKKKHFIIVLIIVLVVSESTASTSYTTNSIIETLVISPEKSTSTFSASISSETTTTVPFTCKSCSVDISVRTTFEGPITTTTTTTEKKSPPGSIYTTYSPTAGPTTGYIISHTSKTEYLTTFYRTTTQLFPGYTTTFITIINGQAIQTEYYIPPSTVIILDEVTAAVDLAIVYGFAKTSSNADDSINLNIWNGKLNRMVICLWAIGVAFIYLILA